MSAQVTASIVNIYPKPEPPPIPAPVPCVQLTLPIESARRLLNIIEAWTKHVGWDGCNTHEAAAPLQRALLDYKIRMSRIDSAMNYTVGPYTLKGQLP